MDGCRNEYASGVVGGGYYGSHTPTIPRKIGLLPQQPGNHYYPTIRRLGQILICYSTSVGVPQPAVAAPIGAATAG